MKRKEVIEVARSYVGTPWTHQGRAHGVDCLGILIKVANHFDYLPEDFDIQKVTSVYHRDPSGELLLEQLRLYMDEVEIKDRKEADIPVIKIPREQFPRHVGFIAYGLYEEMIIHALNNITTLRTVEGPFREWKKYTTNMFRLRGVED